MWQWIKGLFTKTEAFAQSAEAYQIVVGIAKELDGHVDHALTVISQEQVTAEQEIDALIAEMTRKKQGILSGAKKAAHVQQIQAAMRSAVGELKDELEETLEDLGASV